MKRVLPSKLVCCIVALLSGAIANGQTMMTNVETRVDCPENSSDAGPCQRPQIAIAAQTIPLSTHAQIGVLTTSADYVFSRDQADVIKGQPYSAQAVTEIKQTLGDGSHIVQTNTATVARDSEGRTVRVQKLGEIGPWTSSSSQGNLSTLTTIFDSVTKTHIDYSSDSKTAHQLSMPPLPPARTVGSGRVMSGVVASVTSDDATALPAEGVFVQSFNSAGPVSTGANSKTESLGARTIEGLSVTGTRTTVTIPAGKIGNDKDLSIIHETWYSPDLKLVVLSIQDDPRFGRTTYSLTNVRRDEPDASMFQIPSGYKIEKMPIHITTESR